ncbi:hypothetical protein IAR55_000209 [Kwoniella newhampshirensis]|uniref:Uncharacterized protein n=1 Tax=Kwoniella newhampshirensis TaxID=1651941 RepID=A0AAW0Z6G1_9TREE
MALDQVMVSEPLLALLAQYQVNLQTPVSIPASPQDVVNIGKVTASALVDRPLQNPLTVEIKLELIHLFLTLAINVIPSVNHPPSVHSPGSVRPVTNSNDDPGEGNNPGEGGSGNADEVPVEPGPGREGEVDVGRITAMEDDMKRFETTLNKMLEKQNQLVEEHTYTSTFTYNQFASTLNLPMRAMKINDRVWPSGLRTEYRHLTSWSSVQQLSPAALTAWLEFYDLKDRGPHSDHDQRLFLSVYLGGNLHVVTRLLGP